MNLLTWVGHISSCVYPHVDILISPQFIISDEICHIWVLKSLSWQLLECPLGMLSILAHQLEVGLGMLTEQVGQALWISARSWCFLDVFMGNVGSHEKIEGFDMI